VKSYQPVIIIGAPRSGTNMLRDILCQFEKVATWPCDEINYIWRHGNLTYPSDELPYTLATSAVKKYIRKQFDWVAEKYEASIVVEKTCANSLRVPFVNEVIPEAKYIYIVRDGIDVTGSAKLRWTAKLNISYLLQKVRFVPLIDIPYYALRYFRSRIYRLLSHERRLEFWGPSIDGMSNLTKIYNLNEVCALQWKKCVENSGEAFSNTFNERVIYIRYEELVEKPVKIISEIINFIGLSDSPGLIADSVGNISTKSIGKGRVTLNNIEIESLHKLIGDTLKHHGYLI
jgi:hypothetical protein